MKICYFSFDSIGSVFTPLLLDDALINSKDNGHEVHFVYCDASLSSCGINYFKSSSICNECSINRRLLFSKYKNISNIKFIPLSSIKNKSRLYSDTLFKFNSLDQIKKISYRDVNIGLGVVSSFVSKTRNMSPIFSDPVTRNFFTSFLTAACQVVDFVIELEKQNKYDEIRLCNGRLVTERAVFETSKLLKKNINILELSNSNEPFKFRKVFYGNYLPHDIKNGTKLIEEFWDKNKSKSKETEKFFTNRRNAQYASDKVYTKDQEMGLLPENWDYKKRNFVIFNSSEDEVFSIGGFWDHGRIFSTQVDGIKYILNAVKEFNDIQVYLRIHPNLKNNGFSYVNELFPLEKKFKNLIIIKGESKISTYSLIDNSEKCIVFGSSVGIEANYWRKPVICLSPSMYYFLNVSHFPESLKDLDLLLADTLEPKPIIGSLKFALYMFGERGTNYKYVDFNFKVYHFFNKQILINNYLTSKMLFVKFIYRIIRIFSSIKYYNRTSRLHKEL
jgi:hypothetical protein